MTKLYGFYEAQLVTLTAYCLVSLVVQRYLSAKKKSGPNEGDGHSHGRSGWRVAGGETPGYSALMRKYLLVYAVVMGADWLQACCSEHSRHIRVILTGRALRDLMFTLSTMNNIYSRNEWSLFSL